jgi:hypothetical protein
MNCPASQIRKFVLTQVVEACEATWFGLNRSLTSRCIKPKLELEQQSRTLLHREHVHHDRAHEARVTPH